MFLMSCASTPRSKEVVTKYRPGDCIMFSTLAVENGQLASWGIHMSSFKVMGVRKDIKNERMAKFYEADVYYVLKNIIDSEEEKQGRVSFDNLVLPVAAVDSFTYVNQFGGEYRTDGATIIKCNDLRAGL